MSYLVYKILKNIGEEENAKKCYDKIGLLEEQGSLSDAVSAIFRENLKVGTPWL